MKLKHILNVLLASISILGILMLLLGREDVSLPFVAILAVVFSVILTDFTGWVRLNRPLANCAALIAVALSLYDFFPSSTATRGSQTGQLDAITNLLIYLQVILLYQEKSNRVCWQLITLSLLQVLVSAALNDSFFYGVYLLLYSMLAIGALYMMAAYESLNSKDASVDRSGEKEESRVHPFEQEEDSAFSTIVGSQTDQPKVGTYIKSLFNTTVRMTCLTCLITGFLFVLIPRGTGKPLIGMSTDRNPASGFSENVLLEIEGDFIHENPEIAMELELFEAETQEGYLVENGLWLKGKSLDLYKNGEWTGDNKRAPIRNQTQSSATIVQQHIRYQNPASPKCFVEPLINWPRNHRMNDSLTTKSGTVTIQRKKSGKYIFTTNAFYQNRQHPLVPHHRSDRHLSKGSRYIISPKYTKLPSAQDGEKAPKYVKEYTEEILLEAKNEDVDPINIQKNTYAIIRHLESHLKDSGKFKYSLNLPQRDPDLDPIDDFLTKNRTGHCSYFASALAMMCRTQGIPARLAVGYRVGSADQSDNYFQVKQHHAHSWVEVYLKEEQIPDHLKIANEKYNSGAWLRIDPTPPAAEHSMALQTGMLAELRRQKDRLNILWRRYVVNYNKQEQDKLVYKPMKDKATSAAIYVDKKHWLSNLYTTILKLFGFTKDSSLADWISWRGLLFVITMLIFIGCGCYLGWRMYVIVKYLLGQQRTKKQRLARIRDAGFYGQFEDLLQTNGMARYQGQTPYEFCQTVSGQFAENQNLKSVSSIPKKIVSLFYRTRFGSRPLDKAEQNEVEMALQTLKNALKADPL